MVESSYNTDYYDEEVKKPFFDKFKIALGGISLSLSIIIFFSLLSYFFTGSADHSLINSGITFSTFGEEVKNWLGVVGAILSHYLIFITFGISSFLIVPVLIVLSFRLLFNKKIYSLSKISIFSFFGIVWISSFMGFFRNVFPENVFLTNYTGGVGNNFSFFLQNLLGYSSILILLLALFLFVVFYFNIYSFKFFDKKQKSIEEEDTDIFENDDVRESLDEEVFEDDNQEMEEEVISSEDSEDLESKSTNNNENDEKKIKLKVEKRIDEKTSSTLSSEVYDPELDLSNYKYPKIDLLNESDNKKIQVSKEELLSNQEKIKETLRNFKIEIASMKATIGPTVTLYEIVPQAGIKISKIKNLEDDIALSLSALGIRIIAPIPGKGTIGIEVPNKNREIVSLRSVMKTEKFIKSNYELPLILGKTISNEVLLADLTKMPHLLMAGATS